MGNENAGNRECGARTNGNCVAPGPLFKSPHRQLNIKMVVNAMGLHQQQRYRKPAAVKYCLNCSANYLGNQSGWPTTRLAIKEWITEGQESRNVMFFCKRGEVHRAASKISEHIHIGPDSSAFNHKLCKETAGPKKCFPWWRPFVIWQRNPPHPRSAQQSSLQRF